MGRRSELAEADDCFSVNVGHTFGNRSSRWGGVAPDSRRSAAEKLAVLIGFDPTAFHTRLDLRDGKRLEVTQPQQTLRAYLDAVTCVAEEMGRLLASESLPTIS